VSTTVEDDLRTFVHRHSVDCDALTAINPPASWNTGDDALLPLTWFAKWVISEFDLRDERGASLPLATKRQHATISASILTCHAYLVATGKPPTDAEVLMPREVAEDIRAIARADADMAKQVWSSLGRTRSTSSEADRWRRQLVADEQFMQLSHDIANSFLLTVVLPKTASRRRVIKFKYSTPRRAPKSGAAIGGDGRMIPRRQTDERAPVPPDASGAGHIRIETKADLMPRDPFQRSPAPMPISVFVVRNRRLNTRQLVGWERDGSTWVVNLRPGEYEICPELADTCVLVGPEVQRVTVRARKTETVTFEVKEQRIEPIDVSEFQDNVPPRSRFHVQVARSIGIRAIPVLIDVPLNIGGSVHFDVRAPDGLTITRAKLVARKARAEPTSGPSTADQDATILDIVLHSSQNASLYVPEDHMRTGRALAQISVRPNRQTIGNSALATAILAAVLLMALAAKWWITEKGVEAGAALGLAVPGGFAAYAAQGGGSRVIREATAALRILVVAPGVVCFAGAAIVAGTELKSSTGMGDLAVGTLRGDARSAPAAGASLHPLSAGAGAHGTRAGSSIRRALRCTRQLAGGQPMTRELGSNSWTL
jgi:hypothetical protein